MNRSELEQRIKNVLHRVAPEADLSAVEAQTRLREDLEIDSFDFLQVMIGIHEATGIDVPEADYDALVTFGSALDYLERRLSAAPASPAPPST